MLSTREPSDLVRGTPSPPNFESARGRGRHRRGVAYSPTTHPTTMPSDRLSLRVGQLPHDVLAELAARLCSESPALQAATSKMPLPTPSQGAKHLCF